MMRDDRLAMLAKAAGYSLIPPQEIFTVCADTALEMEKENNYEKFCPFFYTKVKKWFLSSKTDGKIPSMRTYLKSWFENHVHI